MFHSRILVVVRDTEGMGHFLWAGDRIIHAKTPLRVVQGTTTKRQGFDKIIIDGVRCYNDRYKSPSFRL